jgi:hypothetical protein
MDSCGTTGTASVELLSFTAEVVSQGVALNWTTASEINNDYFTIERSADAVHFEDLLKVNGAGNSTRHCITAHSINKPLQGISYYRLKQTDFDGTSSWSDAVSVFIGSNENITVFLTRLIFYQHCFFR